MFSDSISDYFEGVAAKYLSAVDAQPDRSNQHEIGGLPKVGFKRYLGEPLRGEKTSFTGRLVYFTDDDIPPTACDDKLTWYGATRRDPNRPLEYRLYYKSNPVTALLNEGDFCLIGKRTDGTLLIVFCPPGSMAETQLRAIFGLNLVDEKFKVGEITSSPLILPVRMLLEDLGLMTAEKQISQADWLDRLVERFGGIVFPQTSEFSAFARECLPSEFNPVVDPDCTLMGWMDHEELLFRTYEHHLVRQRLQHGFGTDGDDVDAFISYSLSVQNRRKSRVGHAFESHLEAIFIANKLQYERPRGKGKVTEQNSKPDFVFPSFSHYHDINYPAERLIVLGAKTTCKDRWRQVLAEANRVKWKHLITLEPSISISQTDEMIASKLHLIVPQPIQTTYNVRQLSSIERVKDFIEYVQKQSV